MTLRDTGRSSTAALGDVRNGRVTRVYLASGRPVCDVTDESGGVWRGCRFLGFGGGAETACYFPPQAQGGGDALPTEGAGSEVQLVFPDGRHAHPYVIAASLHPGNLGTFKEDLEAPGEDQDYGHEGLDLIDVLLKNKGARLILSQIAGIVLDATGSGQPIRVQLAEGKALRISVEGEAEERLILAGPLRAYLDSLAERVNHLGRALYTLENWANTIPTGTVTSGGGQAPITGYQAHVAASGLNPAEIVSPGPDPASGAGAFPATSPSMVAAAVQVSKRPVE